MNQVSNDDTQSDLLHDAVVICIMIAELDNQ